MVFYDQRLIWRSLQDIVNKEIPLSSFIYSFTDRLRDLEFDDMELLNGLC